MEWFPLLVAAVAVAGAIALVVKGWDVRLVLLSAALVIAAAADVPSLVAGAQAGGFRGLRDAILAALAAGKVTAVPREFLATFSNEKFVVPICSAMGFAYVLKHTGCERHLVLLLVKPLRSVRVLLVPGVILVGFVVNIPLISQTSTAVCLGAVVIPLMRAAGYSMATIGACLLLGASVGGELLNPGAPELLTVFSKTGVTTTEQARTYLPPLVFTQLLVATLVIWVMSIWWERSAAASPSPARGEGGGASPPGEGALSDAKKAEQTPSAELHPSPGSSSPRSSEPPSPARGEGEEAAPERINLLKALVPLVPLVLLFAAAPPFSFIDIPDDWVIARKVDGSRDPAYSSRLIGLAMLVGVLVAAAVTPNKARDCVKEFFSGAGYGFTNVVSLIVVATCFGAAIKAAGVADQLGRLIEQAPGLMQPLAAFVPLCFAAISGSGMAATQSLYGFFHGPAVALGLDPVSVGAMVSLGSAAGRTMSPVAAVVLMCGTLTGTNPFTLAKRVAVPLLTGIVVVVLLRLAGIL